MKKIKISAVVAIIAMLFSGSVFAQGPGGPGGQGGGPQGPPPIPDAKEIKKMVAKMDKTVEFTDEQEEKVLALYTDHFKAVKKEVSASSRPDREKMEALDKAVETKVCKVLSEEQQKKYKAYLKKNSRSQGGRPPQR